MANPNPSPETRWKPGQSGNPGGRPKGTLADKLRALLDTETKTGSGVTWGDALARKLLVEAMKAKPFAMALIAKLDTPNNAEDGKPTAVEVRVVYVDKDGRPGSSDAASRPTEDSQGGEAI